MFLLTIKMFWRNLSLIVIAPASQPPKSKVTQEGKAFEMSYHPLRCPTSRIPCQKSYPQRPGMASFRSQVKQSTLARHSSPAPNFLLNYRMVVLLILGIFKELVGYCY
uniref:Uncharacterized protein n=1 Tax=Sphaerodactylus townsendi TaxID=933632 RepID=A0ACB8FSD0_9SAUR